jgi:hypothetical protein
MNWGCCGTEAEQLRFMFLESHPNRIHRHNTVHSSTFSVWDSAMFPCLSACNWCLQSARFSVTCFISADIPLVKCSCTCGSSVSCHLSQLLTAVISDIFHKVIVRALTSREIRSLCCPVSVTCAFTLSHAPVPIIDSMPYFLYFCFGIFLILINCWFKFPTSASSLEHNFVFRFSFSDLKYRVKFCESF